MLTVNLSVAASLLPLRFNLPPKHRTSPAHVFTNQRLNSLNIYSKKTISAVKTACQIGPTRKLTKNKNIIYMYIHTHKSLQRCEIKITWRDSGKKIINVGHNSEFRW